MGENDEVWSHKEERPGQCSMRKKLLCVEKITSDAGQSNEKLTVNVDER